MQELADALAGGVGMPADQKSATALYLEAGEGGNTEAAFSAAYRTLLGIGTEANKTIAQKYFTLAASQNHGGAHFWLGILAEEKSNHQTALDHYRFAASQAVPKSYDRLAALLNVMPATAENLVTLHALASQDVRLDDKVKQSILTKDYLPILGREDAKFLQTKLTELGFDTKGVDGSIGPNSKKALAAYQASLGRKIASEPTLTILDLKGLGFF